MICLVRLFAGRKGGSLQKVASVQGLVVCVMNAARVCGFAVFVFVCTVVCRLPNRSVPNGSERLRTAPFGPVLSAQEHR